MLFTFSLGCVEQCTDGCRIGDYRCPFSIRRMTFSRTKVVISGIEVVISGHPSFTFTDLEGSAKRFKGSLTFAA